MRLTAFGDHFGQDSAPTQEGQGPKSEHADKVKLLNEALLTAVKNHDEATATEVLTNILGTDREAVALEKEIKDASPVHFDAPGLINQLHTLRFKAARIASHLFRSLTPDGREKNRALITEILNLTPHLGEGHRREHWVGDDELRRFQYPKGNLEHGRKLGIEKQRLRMTEEDFVRRQGELKNRRDEARKTGRPFREGDASDAFTAPAAPAAPPATPVEKKQAAAEAKANRAVNGWGLGYLGQTPSPEVASYLNQQEAAFRAGTAETKADILDKVATLNEAANAGMSPSDAIKTAEGGGVPMIAIGIGAVVLVAALYFFFKK